MKTLLFRTIGSFILVFLVLAGVFSLGQQNVQAKWDIAKIAHDKAIAKYEGEIKQIRETHAQKVDSLEKQLEDKDKEYEERVIALRTSATDRLRESTQRADLYLQQARAGTIEQERLASHAAELDRHLVEGKAVARELRYLVELRDNQIRLLGQQIEADRQALKDAQ